jgi:hypothetical protein
MARPIGKLHQEDVRRKIQVSQLLNVLQDHALSPDSGDISSSRMKAIEILLRKSLPDLTAISMEGPTEDEGLIGRIERTLIRANPPA